MWVELRYLIRLSWITNYIHNSNHFPPRRAAELKLEPINLESLRVQKNFLKSTKKQQKELESLRKKQAKERQGVQKQQCQAIDKVSKGKKWVGGLCTV